jgi:hypothetical protein
MILVGAIGARFELDEFEAALRVCVRNAPAKTTSVNSDQDIVFFILFSNLTGLGPVDFANSGASIHLSSLKQQVKITQRPDTLC